MCKFHRETATFGVAESTPSLGAPHSGSRWWPEAARLSSRPRPSCRCRPDGRVVSALFLTKSSSSSSAWCTSRSSDALRKLKRIAGGKGCGDAERGRHVLA